MQSEEKPPNPEVKRLVHVVCLPLQLKFKGRPAQSIAEIRPHLTCNGLWQELPHKNPWADEALTQEQQWQARSYFHPFVRRFLFDPDRTFWLQRKDVRQLRIAVPKAWGLDSFQIDLQVSRCLLALFQPDIACVMLELEYQASANNPPMQIHELQRLIDRVRRVYPPYFPLDEKGAWSGGGHCADSVELLDETGKRIGEVGEYGRQAYKGKLNEAGQSGSWKPGWAAHWKTLLAPLQTDATVDTGLGVRQFGDDRAAIISYVAFNDPCSLKRGQWVRLCFADDHGNDPLPYSQEYLKDFEQRHCYDRYWYTGNELNRTTGQVQTIDSLNAPSRILNCGYAFTYAGMAGNCFFEEDPTGALFSFRHIYCFMGLIVHMQRAALLAASHRLTHLVNRHGSQIDLPDREQVRNFYDQFVEFTQIYWFDEVTPQEQGQQIFDQWQKHLRVQPLYDEVRQELRDLAEYSELRATNRLNDNVARLGLASLVLAALAVMSGVLGMNIFNENVTGLKDHWFTTIWPSNGYWPVAIPFWLAFASGLIALALFGVSSYSWLKHLKRRPSN